VNGRSDRRVPLSRALAAILVMALAWPLLVGFGESAESHNRRGNRLYRQGEYDKALEQYRGAQVLDPDIPGLALNAGDALFRKDEFQDSVREFSVASAAADSIMSGNAFYNAGNALMAAGDLDGAIESYKAALIRHPRDADAKFNLELALRKREEHEKQQQSRQGENGQNQEQQNQKSQQDQQNQQNQENQGQEQQQQQQQQQQQPAQEQPQQGQQEQQQSQEQQNQEGQARMSRADAERLLDAIDEAEKELQAELRAAPAKERKKVEKDW
jgi:Ca-activated chloride channel family protein